MNKQNQFSMLITSLLMAGSCAGLGNVESDGLADSNGTTRGGTCTVLQRIQSTDSFVEYTQDRLNAAAQLDLGGSFRALLNEVVPGYRPPEISLLPGADYTYSHPDNGETMYATQGEFVNGEGSYCYNVYFDSLETQLISCWDKAYQGNSFRTLVSQMLVDSKGVTHYDLNGNDVIEIISEFGSNDENIYYYDQDEDRNLDRYMKEYVREGFFKGHTIPSKFDPWYRCKIENTSSGPTTIINDQQIQYYTTELGVETLRLDHEGYFECANAMPKGWACVEGYSPIAEAPDTGNDNNNGGGISRPGDINDTEPSNRPAPQTE